MAPETGLKPSRTRRVLSLHWLIFPPQTTHDARFKLDSLSACLTGEADGIFGYDRMETSATED
jgi:hypothetical protein